MGHCKHLFVAAMLAQPASLFGQTNAPQAIQTPPRDQVVDGDRKARLDSDALRWYQDSLESADRAKKPPCPPKPPIAPFRAPQGKLLSGEPKREPNRDCKPSPDPLPEPPIPVFDRHWSPSPRDAESFRHGLEDWRTEIENQRQSGEIRGGDYLHLQNEYQRGIEIYKDYNDIASKAKSDRTNRPKDEKK
ncbi:MAG TPA: hypothetical protein VMH05_13165 [Bryobacteraceae bacterium]|nr:hypothetical protein [Bryobacteraceae bacterium]